MSFVRVVVFLLGLWVVLGTLSSAIRTVVLPRSAVSFLTRAVFSMSRSLFNLLAHDRRQYEDRDRVMAMYAPVSLVMLPAAWLSLVLLAYMAMFWATGGFNLSEAFAVSGSSLLTLGFTPVETTGERLLAFSEAVLGLGLVALLITFLPSMYAAFSRRESMVALLEVRAGSPPFAVEMIERVTRIGWLDKLPEVWERWETWFADLEESHTSYPALAFFRSPQSDRSWVVAAGTVIDAAALVASTVDIPNQPEAQLCIRSGFIALRRIGAFFGIQFDADPSPDDPISVTRVEFEEACVRMAAAGVPLRPDLDQAWRDWAGWRVNYDTVLLALAERLSRRTRRGPPTGRHHRTGPRRCGNGGGPVHSMMNSSSECATRSEFSTSRGVAPLAKRNPRYRLPSGRPRTASPG